MSNLEAIDSIIKQSADIKKHLESDKGYDELNDELKDIDDELDTILFHLKSK